MLQPASINRHIRQRHEWCNELWHAMLVRMHAVASRDASKGQSLRMWSCSGDTNCAAQISTATDSVVNRLSLADGLKLGWLATGRRKSMMLTHAMGPAMAWNASACEHVLCTCMYMGITASLSHLQQLHQMSVCL